MKTFATDGKLESIIAIIVAFIKTTCVEQNSNLFEDLASINRIFRLWF